MLYQLCRLFCLLLLGLNVAAAAINPSSIVALADADSRLPTTLPNVGEGPVGSISQPQPRRQSPSKQIYNEYRISPAVEDADRANVNADLLEEYETAIPDRFVTNGL